MELNSQSQCNYLRAEPTPLRRMRGPHEGPVDGGGGLLLRPGRVRRGEGLLQRADWHQAHVQSSPPLYALVTRVEWTSGI